MSKDQIQFFAKTHESLKSTFHGSRLQNLPENLLRNSNDPKISDLKTSNGDMLFGPGVYTALENSAKNYVERRKGSLFEVDITGKKFFDYRKINSLFVLKDDISKFTKMFNSNNLKVKAKACEILVELKIILTEFTKFLDQKIAEIKAKNLDLHKENNILTKNASCLKLIKNLNQQNLADINSGNIQDIQGGIDLGEKITDQNKDYTIGVATYYLGLFCQNFGFEGIIGLESADWNYVKNGKAGKNLTYVIFDPNFEGIPAKKVD